MKSEGVSQKSVGAYYLPYCSQEGIEAQKHSQVALKEAEPGLEPSSRAHTLNPYLSPVQEGKV